MAEAIGAAVVVTGLLDAALTVIQKVRAAKAYVKGTTKTLEQMSQQLDGLVRSLTLVKAESSLQTASIARQLSAIIDIGNELHGYFAGLRERQQRTSSALKAGDDDDKELGRIVERLDGARSEPMLCIDVAQVGLIGNLADGFRVASQTLVEVDDKVKGLSGKDLNIAAVLKDRAVETAEDGTIRLTTEDMERLPLNDGPEGRRASPPPLGGVSAGESRIYDNITVGQARIMTGDVGAEHWHQLARRTTIAHNKFGQDVRIMTGNVGAEASKEFMSNFWK